MSIKTLEELQQPDEVGPSLSPEVRRQRPAVGGDRSGEGRVQRRDAAREAGADGVD